MRVRLLGPVEVLDGDHAIPLGPPRQRAVLAMLALAAPDVVSTDRFVDGLWGEEPPEKPLAALQVFVHGLRKALRTVGADGLVERVAPGYRLAVAPEQTDVGEFLALTAAARGHRGAGDTTAEAEALSAALRLWRGPALADVSAAPFAEPEAVRLQDIRLLAEEDLFDARIRLGDHAAVVGDLEQRVHEHPMRERFWGQLMTALYRCDRQADALATYARARERLADELGIDPGQALQALEVAILRQDPSLDAPAPPPAATARAAEVRVPLPRAEAVRPAARVPVPTTPTFGRDELVREVRAAVADPAVRAVTLTGPGGSGKSRVAAIAAADLAGEFPDGVVFLAATELTHSVQLARELALHLTGRDGDGEDPLDGVSARALIVLDNLEALDDGARLVAALVQRTEHVTVLATSRVPLRFRAEREVPVPPLAVPDTDAPLEEVAGFPAVQMFLDRATAVAPTFSLVDHLEDVAELCRFLDGFPLALELAAAQVRVLTPAQVLSGVQRDLGLLSARGTDLPERQRTLAAALQWSYDRLRPEARLVLDRLALFERSFTVEAVEAVCDDVSGVLEALADIVEARLVRPSPAQVEVRFTLLGTVRAAARIRLDSQPGVELRREALAEYLLGRAREWATGIDGSDGTLQLARYGDSAADLDAALTWAVATGRTSLAVDLATTLTELWIASGRLSEGAARSAEVLALPDLAPSDAAAVRLGGAKLAYHLSDFARTEQECRELLNDPKVPHAVATGARCYLGAALVVTGRPEEGAELANEALAASEGDYPLPAVALSVLAISRAVAGDAAGERAFYEQRLAVVAERGDLARLADTLNTLAEIALDDSDSATARAYAEESVAIAGSGLPIEARDATISLARAGVAEGDAATAATHLRQALRLADRTGQRLALAQCLRVAGCLAVLHGEPGPAVRAFAAAQALSPSPSGTDEPIEADLAGRLAEARAALGTAAYDREWLLGRTMPVATVRAQLERSLVTRELAGTAGTPGRSADLPGVPSPRV